MDRIFKRKLYDKLLEWKRVQNGKTAILIEGARRVGKSTLVEQFAKNEYESYILVDFNEASDEVKSLFKDLMNMDYIFLQLQVLYNVVLKKRKSVIIFDEVQNCPLARQAIKYLVKDGRYDYIETGSLISIKKNTNINIGIKLYGFLNMATSSRKLLTNYFDYIKENKEKDNYTIEDKVKKEKYKVVEDRDTNFFTGKVLNGIKYLPKLIDNGLDFIFLDDYMLNANDFYNIIEAFSSLRNAKDDKEFVKNLIDVVNCNTYYDTFDGFYIDFEWNNKLDTIPECSITNTIKIEHNFLSNNIPPYLAAFCWHRIE